MSVSSKILDVIRRHFVGGVLVVVPFILTFMVLRFLFEAIDGLLEPVLAGLLGYYRTGLGLITTLLIVLLVGTLTRNLIGARLYRIGDKMLAKLPLIRPIYFASKQLLEGLVGDDTKSFKEVALIEYPRKGLTALCFISRWLNVDRGSGVEYCAVCFVPSTPTPVSGMVVMVPRNDVTLLAMTVEDGIKFLVSGGVASPEVLKYKAKSGLTG